MARTYSLKKQHPRATALVVAEELARALPDTVIVGSLRRGCEIVEAYFSSFAALRLLPAPLGCPAT
jgi:hypothetical protein